jgi:CHASE3 domain sensor protein
MTTIRPKADHYPPRVLALMGGFILLLAVVLAVAWLQRFQETSAEWVRHTLEVENSLARIFSLIQDTETGQRGYLLTGNRSYLTPFADADPQIDPELEKLDRLVSDNPGQQQRVLALRSVANEKRAALRRVLDLYDAGDSEAALLFLRQGVGKALMDRVRNVVVDIKGEEDNLLVARTNLVQRNSHILGLVLVFAALLALGVAVLAILDLRHYAQENQIAYELVASANNMLVREAEERDRIAAQLRQSQKMEVTGQLTGGLAHDFNNMLAVVIGNLNLLKRRLASGQTDVNRFIDGAIEGADRAAVLTHRLPAFSRQQPLAPDAIDANKLVTGMTELLRRTLSEAVVLETVLAGGVWRTHVDANQLENAIMNLAVNARDAMPEGGKLTIETANAHLDEAYAADHIEVATPVKG